jgi:VanZ family protein
MGELKGVYLNNQPNSVSAYATHDLHGFAHRVGNRESRRSTSETLEQRGDELLSSRVNFDIENVLFATFDSELQGGCTHIRVLDTDSALLAF